VLSAALLLLGACLAQPFEPAGARAFTAPPVYTVWWQRMETCAEITAPLDRVDWYEVPGDQFATPSGPRWGWWEPPHTIYVATTHLSDEQLVEHEMLHDLLQTGAHPTAFATCGVQETDPVTADRRLLGADVQRNDRRPPMQVQHGRVGPDDREVIGEHFHVASLNRRDRHS
jgi:hypothetical protein